MSKTAAGNMGGRRSRRAQASVLSALAVGVGAISPIAAGQTAATPSVLGGAYTEEQAVLGQSLYYQSCLSCHGETMSGLDQAPPLAGPEFASVWAGESIAALVERIDTMPPTAPGSLSRTEGVAVLAYILWYNGLPMGNLPLSEDPAVLSKMAFESPLPGQ